jgi:hypothetical protein
VPEQALSEASQEYLRRRRDPSRQLPDPRSACAPSCRLEDSAHWLPGLREELQRVLRHLLALPAPSGLPLGLLVEETEDLLAHLRTLSPASAVCIERNYCAKLLIEAGVSPHAALEAYLDLLDRSVEWAADRQVQLLASFSAVLADWMQTAARLDKQRAVQAIVYVDMIRTGVVRSWLEKARRHLSSLQGRRLSNAQLGPLLEEVTAELHATNKTMQELTFRE